MSSPLVKINIIEVNVEGLGVLRAVGIELAIELYLENVIPRHV